MNQNNTTRILMLLVAVILLVGSSFIAFQQYNQTRSSVDRVQSENRMLENRLLVLEESSTYVAAYVPPLTAAVPASNAGYFGLSTVKAEANEQSLLVDNVAVRSVSQADQPIAQSEISFEVEGPSSAILAFTGRLFSSFPVMTMVSLNNRVVNDTSALSRSQIVLKAVSKAFPAQLPSLTEAIVALSVEERAAIEELFTFQKETTSGTAPSEPDAGIPFGRTNPFSPAETINVTTSTDEVAPIEEPEE